MEQELLGLVQAVKDVAPQVWAAARLAVISGAVVDIITVAVFGCAIAVVLRFTLRLKATGEWSHDSDVNFAKGLAVCGGAFGVGILGVFAHDAILHLIAPDWYTIQLLLSQLPGNGG
jgi:nitrate reductase gamma subunit